MPLYEYRCNQCSHRFELLVGSSSKGPEKCPSCSAPNPEKQFSAFAVGSGSSGAKFEAPPNCAGCSGGAGCPYSKG